MVYEVRLQFDSTCCEDGVPHYSTEIVYSENVEEVVAEYTAAGVKSGM
jgi:hypothetical protein